MDQTFLMVHFLPCRSKGNQTQIPGLMKDQRINKLFNLQIIKLKKNQINLSN